MVSSLCRKLGDATNTEWGLPEEEGSGAYNKDIPKILSKEMGYSYPSKKEDYNSNSVISSLKENNPVPIILGGFREENTEGWWIFKYKTYDKGHTWLVDGLCTQERLVERISIETKKVVSSHTDYRTLIHCNWGWMYRKEGYYLPDVFNADSPEEESIEMRSSTQDKTRHYKYELKCIRGIRP